MMSLFTLEQHNKVRKFHVEMAIENIYGEDKDLLDWNERLWKEAGHPSPFVHVADCLKKAGYPEVANEALSLANEYI